MTTVNFKGNPVKIAGNLPKVGAKAPDFELVSQNLERLHLDHFAGKKLLLNIFPSMDTDVCAKSVRTFDEKKGSDLTVLNISLDLPFAAKRFCSANALNAQTLSAFASTFADDYGVRILEGPLKGLCARAVIVLDADHKVAYVELVPEITQEPNYEACFKA